MYLGLKPSTRSGCIRRMQRLGRLIHEQSWQAWWRYAAGLCFKSICQVDHKLCLLTTLLRQLWASSRTQTSRCTWHASLKLYWEQLEFHSCCTAGWAPATCTKLSWPAELLHSKCVLSCQSDVSAARCSCASSAHCVSQSIVRGFPAGKPIRSILTSHPDCSHSLDAPPGDTRLSIAALSAPHRGP